MKAPLALATLLLINPVHSQQKAESATPADKALQGPLRKFDLDKNGVLNAEELKAARQAHNRGGREAEPTPGRLVEIMERMKRDFSRRYQKDFDLNNDGKLEGAEREAAEKIWQSLIPKFTEIRRTVTDKYDKNDDGELGENERGESRKEMENLRTEATEEAIRKWKAEQATTPAP